MPSQTAVSVPPVAERLFLREAAPRVRPIYIATVLRPEGDTGIQTHFNTFVRWAQQAGAAVRLVTPFDDARALPALGLGRLFKPFDRELWMWWYRRSRYSAIRRQLLRHLERTEPAVVYAQDPLSARAALDARDSGYPIEVAMMVHFNVSHADELVEKGDIAIDGRVYREIVGLERDVLRRVDRLIFPSQFAARAVAPSAGEAHGPIHCIPNFVAEPAVPAVAQRDLLESKRLISIGTLEPRKNFDFLLHVVAHAHRRGCPCRLTIVGDGPDRRHLDTLATRLGVGSHVTLTGYVRNAATLLPQHAVYVHAARMENLPMALLEALAAGKPVCAGAVGGIPEVIADGVEGVHWRLDDPAGAADALVRLLRDAARYERMSQAARLRHREHFSLDVLGPRLWRTILGHADDAHLAGGASATVPGGAS